LYYFHCINSEYLWESGRRIWNRNFLPFVIIWVHHRMFEEVCVPSLFSFQGSSPNVWRGLCSSSVWFSGFITECLKRSVFLLCLVFRVHHWMFEEVCVPPLFSFQGCVFLWWESGTVYPSCVHKFTTNCFMFLLHHVSIE
jgi:hypothetical protein